MYIYNIELTTSAKTIMTTCMYLLGRVFRVERHKRCTQRHYTHTLLCFQHKCAGMRMDELTKGSLEIKVNLETMTTSYVLLQNYTLYFGKNQLKFTWFLSESLFTINIHEKTKLQVSLIYRVGIILSYHCSQSYFKAIH